MVDVLAGHLLHIRAELERVLADRALPGIRTEQLLRHLDAGQGLDRGLRRRRRAVAGRIVSREQLEVGGAEAVVAEVGGRAEGGAAGGEVVMVVADEEEAVEVFDAAVGGGRQEEGRLGG